MSSQKNVLRLVLTTTVFVLGWASVPAADLGEELGICSALENDTERLACFDGIITATDESSPKTSDLITSRHVGEFRGWAGDTVFHLENGQTWRQAENGRMHWVADSPLITIRRTSIGTYWLSVEGVKTELRVRRVE